MSYIIYQCKERVVYHNTTSVAIRELSLTRIRELWSSYKENFLFPLPVQVKFYFQVYYNNA